MILLDNSQYMRNGDYIPNRLAAQQDAANLLVRHKTSSNPESTVGIIAMNGGCFTQGVELLVSPTDDIGKLLTALHKIPIRGGGELLSDVDVPASVQVASLALKHRRNKNGQQRIVIFVASPLTHVEKKALVKAGKALKKNNVAVDVVAMGELEENEEKLTDLVNAANGNSDEKLSHLVTIPAGTLPSDVLVSSPVIHGGDAPMGGGGGGAAAPSGGGGAVNDFSEYGGVDPNLDPELAMALRISMEEERARQERIAQEQQASNDNEESKDGGDEPSPAAATTSNEESKQGDNDVNMEETTQTLGADVSMMNAMGDEDAMLQQALAMSMAENNPSGGESHMEQDDDGDDDADMQMALAMSMPGTEEAETQQQEQFQDPQFVNELISSVPGVDPNDPAIRRALESLEKANQKSGDDDKKDEGDDKKE